MEITQQRLESDLKKIINIVSKLSNYNNNFEN